MIKGLTRAGIGNGCSLADFIRMASANGIGAIDVNCKEIKDLINQQGVSGFIEVLQQNRMQIGAINLPIQWRMQEEQFREGLNLLVQDAEAASRVGCTIGTSYISPSTKQNAAPFMAAAIKRLRICAEILDAFGIKLALEFVGPHHLRTIENNVFIWTAEDTLTMIEAIGRRNVGLLYDSFHWHTNGLTVKDILKLDQSQIVHVHINDAPLLPIADILDNDRRYPGEGSVDLVGFLQALKQIGYQGVVSQEVLLKQPPQESVEELIRKSGVGMQKIFASAGLPIPEGCNPYSA
jgi:sugar phosphate isomerase/epimerase